MEAGTTVEIRSRLAGTLDKVLFKEGAAVKKDDVLFQLDDRLQRAEVDKAQAEVKRTEARLKGAELDHARLVRLGEAKSVSRDEVEKVGAAVDEAKAAVLATRAALDVARIKLEFSRLVSPIDGRIGRAKVTAGSVVQSADLLATVYALDPLYVYFDLDERTLLRLVRYTRERKGEKTTVGLALAGDEGFPHKGVVDFLEQSVDPKTGTLRWKSSDPDRRSAFACRSRRNERPSRSPRLPSDGSPAVVISSWW
jgi:membrane fusion protein, multidrug efflux system